MRVVQETRCVGDRASRPHHAVGHSLHGVWLRVEYDRSAKRCRPSRGASRSAQRESYRSSFPLTFVISPSNAQGRGRVCAAILGVTHVFLRVFASAPARVCGTQVASLISFHQLLAPAPSRRLAQRRVGMRRSTVAALLLAAAASSSQCSDSTAPIGVLPSPNPSGAAFSNSGSLQGSGTGTTASGPVSSISSLTVTIVSDSNGDGRPNRGDSVTCAISTTQTWTQVSVVCSQNGEVVLRAARTAKDWSPISLTSEM